MDWIYNDGGRLGAGFVTDRVGDCVTRSISIATRKSYREVYEALNLFAKLERRGRTKKGLSSSCQGVYRGTYERYLKMLGWTWAPTMGIGTGCRVHLRDGELPAGRLIVSLIQHMTCVIDGVIYDTHDPSRGGKRCVYGYWKEPECKR